MAVLDRHEAFPEVCFSDVNVLVDQLLNKVSLWSISWWRHARPLSVWVIVVAWKNSTISCSIFFHFFVHLFCYFAFGAAAFCCAFQMRLLLGNRASLSFPFLTTVCFVRRCSRVSLFSLMYVMTSMLLTYFWKWSFAKGTKFQNDGYIIFLSIRCTPKYRNFCSGKHSYEPYMRIIAGKSRIWMIDVSFQVMFITLP